MLEDERPDLDEIAREQIEDALVDGDVDDDCDGAFGEAIAELRFRRLRVSDDAGQPSDGDPSTVAAAGDVPDDVIAWADDLARRRAHCTAIYYPRIS